ncbi:hypothetical protein [Streptomyces sp. UH6]|uniref:hypothetical protein n=1 Tax=Streptomyces sp. UH6 TaxID=2748379 RepID=UPI00211DAE69|nr:hypothetical protein [Streptomyces sp. UH6]
MAEWVRHLTVTPSPRTGRPAGPSTIERALAAVTTWHQEQGRPKPTMRGAPAVFNAYKDHLAETKAAAAQPKQATAALPKQIRVMLTGVDRATLAGKRNAAGHDPLEIARSGGWVDGSRVHRNRHRLLPAGNHPCTR